MCPDIEWQSEQYEFGYPRLRAEFRARIELLEQERDLWQRRAEAQLDITRAAVAIVAAPLQIYDSRVGQRGYRISTQEFEELQRAVDAYQKLAAQEADARSESK